MKKFAAFLFLSVLAGTASYSQTLESQWKGRKVAFIGDSVTDPRQTSSQTVYWQDLAGILGIEPLVYAVSGYQMSHLPKLLGLLEEEHGQEVDAILVFLGTNDYNASVPMGEWYSERDSVVNVDGQMLTRRYREFLFDDNTYRGRINTGIRLLKTTYPDKQIILLTPIHRDFAVFGSTNVQQNENFANGEGLYVDSYVGALREAGSLWSVPVIDLNALCGLNPTLPEYIKYFRNPVTDHLHPNSEGHLRMALTIAYRLITYPVF